MQKFIRLLIFSLMLCMGSYCFGQQDSQSGYLEDYLLEFGGVIYAHNGFGLKSDLERLGLRGQVKELREIDPYDGITVSRTLYFDHNGFIRKINAGGKDIEYIYDSDMTKLLSINFVYIGFTTEEKIMYDGDKLLGATYASTGKIKSYKGDNKTIHFIAPNANRYDGIIRIVYVGDLNYIMTWDRFRISEIRWESSFGPHKNVDEAREYIYGQYGEVTQIKNHYYKPGTTTGFTFNAGGNNTGRPLTGSSNYEYKFDGQKNWTEKTKLSKFNGRITDREVEEKRQIIYYGEGETYRHTHTHTGLPEVVGGVPKGLDGEVQQQRTTDSLPDNTAPRNTTEISYNQAASGTQRQTGTEHSIPRKDTIVIIKHTVVNGGTVIKYFGQSSSGWGSGKGEETTPYIISNVEDLVSLARRVNNGESFAGKHFLLVNNLDLEFRGAKVAGQDYPWIPIGKSADKPFSGIFHGSDKTISGLSVDTGDTENAIGGLFGYISASGSVRNLHLDNTCSVKSKTAGGIAAVNNGGIFFCTSAATVAGEHAGGIAGENNRSVMACHSSATVEPTVNGGGICAINISEVSFCGFDGAVNFFSISKCVGGIVGELSGSGLIKHCYNRGKLTANIAVLGVGVGGITGTKNLPPASEPRIVNCYSAGTGRGGHIMPDLKKNIGSVTECYFDVDTKPLSRSEKKDENWYMTHGGMSANSMKSEEFLRTLNSIGNQPWVLGSPDINGGYPFLRIILNPTSH